MRLLFLLVVLLSGCSLLTPNVSSEFSKLEAGQYQLDANHASVHFKVLHMGLSTFVGRFNKLQASLNFDPKNIQGIFLDARVNTESIDTNNSELDKQLRSGRWFDTTVFPQARFITQRVTARADNHYAIFGQLTLHGITKPVVLDAIFHGGADNLLTGFYTLGFSATTQIKRSDFAIDSYLGLVGDLVELEIYAEFQRH